MLVAIGSEVDVPVPLTNDRRRRRYRPAGPRSLGIDRVARRGGHGLRRHRACPGAPCARHRVGRPRTGQSTQCRRRAGAGPGERRAGLPGGPAGQGARGARATRGDHRRPGASGETTGGRPEPSCAASPTDLRHQYLLGYQPVRPVVRWRIPAHRGPGGAAEASCACPRGVSGSLSRPDTGLVASNPRVPSLHARISLRACRAGRAVRVRRIHARVAGSARVLTE